MTIVRVGASFRGNALVKWSVWKVLDHVSKVFVQGSDRVMTLDATSRITPVVEPNLYFRYRTNKY